MSDREIMAKFNSLLNAGLSLDQAARAAESAKLSERCQVQHRYLVAVCNEAGAAPVAALRCLEQIAEQQFESEAKLRVSGTVPKATARLVLWLPVGAALLGQLAGLESISVFFESLFALTALLLGLMLLVAAQVWSGRILSTAIQIHVAEEIVLDAIALCLGAGLSLQLASQISVKNFTESFGHEPSKQILEEFQELSDFSDSTGAPIAKLFCNRAEVTRRLKAHKQSELLERVSIRLLAPLAIFVLPAFVLIAVLPMSIVLLTSP
jgi:tight adherence protein B